MNTKLTNILLIVLLLCNVAFLGSWWMGHMRMHHPRKDMDNSSNTILDKSKGERFLMKTLAFDTNQRVKLDNLIEGHKKFLDKFMGDNTRLQSEFFEALKNNADSVSISRIADSMGIVKTALEKELFIHFNSVKRICNNEQSLKFNELMDNMSKEFVQRHQPHPDMGAKQDSL